MAQIDDLIARWKAHPDAANTLALADALRASVRPEVARSVSDFVQKNLADDVGVLTAAGRMCLAHGLLPDAQQHLVAAGKLAPRSALLYRLLGEALLRRGDAERAEKIFERGTRLGADPELRKWHLRARSYRALQVSEGAKAVANDLATHHPLEHEAGSDETGQYLPIDDIDTSVKSAKDDIQPAIDALRARRAALPAVTPAPRKVHPPGPPPPGPPPPGPPPPTPPPASHEEKPQPRDNGASSWPLARAIAPLPASVAPSGGAPPAQPPPTLHTESPPPRVPEARDVLDALAIAGVFEPEASVRVLPPWVNPAPERPRRSWMPLVALLVLLVGASLGTFFYVRDRRTKEHALAEGLLARVDEDLRTGDPAILGPSEQALARAFELESRSPHAALAWLHERVAVGLVRGGENVAFEDAMKRARDVGVKDSDIAFAHVASFLFQGDTAGAASAVHRWDREASQDAYYQLLSGAALERAGDPRATERYVAATRLDPGLVMAEVALARHIAVDDHPLKAMELARLFQSKYPQRIEASALVALAWARNPRRAQETPGEVKITLERAGELPRGLRFVPHALQALRALGARAPDEARMEIERGLAVADSPGIASWLGAIALGNEDEAQARKAALLAVSFSGIHPPARVLAARVALLGDRLDDAQKATDNLDPGLADVALVRATVAYERLDSDALDRALDALAPESKELPFMRPILSAKALLVGSEQPSSGKIAQMALTDAPWADVLAMDAALDTGTLSAADKIAQAWGADDRRPHHAVRLARHARYRGKLDEAEAWSKAALGGTITARSLIERVFVLVARREHKAIEPLLLQYPNVLGKLTRWASAYGLASSGKTDMARARIATENPPPELTPLPPRFLAGATYAAVRDHNAGFKYIKALAGAGFANPDVAAASLAIGAGEVRPRSR